MCKLLNHEKMQSRLGSTLDTRRSRIALKMAAVALTAGVLSCTGLAAADLAAATSSSGTQRNGPDHEILRLTERSDAEPELGRDEDLEVGGEVRDDGDLFLVSRIAVRYPGEQDRELGFIPIDDHPNLPPLAELAHLPVVLGVLDGDFVAPREGIEHVEATLADLPAGGYRMSALEHIGEVVVRHFNEQERILGVFAAYDNIHDLQANQITQPGELRMIVVVGIVAEVRTLASGDRIDPEDRVNHAVHERIRRRSPIRAIGPDDDPEDPDRSDLIREDELNRYMHRLSRHPGRRVDASLGPGPGRPYEDMILGGDVAVDYIVNENRPLMLYAQTSNTGTRQTGRWRQRFGLMHTQLTNNDDIFNIEYITTNFSDVHAVNASYSAPFFGSDTLRWQVYGGYSRFTASEVGFFDDVFKGRSWTVGGQLAWNFLQHDDLFLDLIGGVRYSDISVDNRAVLLKGKESFIIPYTGVALERNSEWFSTNAQLIFEFQSGSLSSVDEGEMNRLGRLFPDRSWTVMRWDASHSFFLEPLFDRDALTQPDPDQNYTMAHEVMLGFRGQYAFGNRLIPQEQQVAGGMYTVRGYPESITAGDTVLIGTAEYRFHLPRAFEIEPEPSELLGRPFRWAPQYTYGRPDWDFILRGFVDVGRTRQSDPFFFEFNDTLVGAGVGAELILWRNFSARLDWGFALKSIDRLDIKSGSSRVHFAATLVF